MAINTGGFGVPVMPQVDFSLLSNAIASNPSDKVYAGFDQGIGSVNALQNTRQKALLNPIAVDEANARLAQIQAEADLTKARVPYQQQLAQLEAYKALHGSYLPTGSTIRDVPRAVPQADNPMDQIAAPIDTVEYETGTKYNPATKQWEPYEKPLRVLSTQEQKDLNQSLKDYRTGGIDVRQQMADTAAQRANDLATYQQQIAQIRSQGEKDRAQYNADRISHLKALEASGSYQLIQTKDNDGNVVVNAIPKRQGLPTPPPFYTGMKPIKSAGSSSMEAQINEALGLGSTTPPPQPKLAPQAQSTPTPSASQSGAAPLKVGKYTVRVAGAPASVAPVVTPATPAATTDDGTGLDPDTLDAIDKVVNGTAAP